MSQDPNLEDLFPNMKPISSPPSLSTMNGIGFTMPFSRDHDETTGTYVATRYFSVIFIPLVAIDSWRVADYPGGGWYFLGKEPMSGAAKGWNAFLFLGILALVGGLWWNHHVNTPEYRNGQRMAQAEQLMQQKKVVEAAGLYRDVLDVDETTSHHKPAKEKLEQILKGDKRVPLKTMASVYTSTMQWAGRPGDMANPYELAKALLKERGMEDPAEALKLIKSVERLNSSLQDLALLRQPFLEAELKKDPGNLNLITELALVYETRNEPKKCEALLVPHQKKLGTTEGARILGQVLAKKKDRIDEADALLMPYVQSNLARLKDAQEKFFGLQQEIVQELLQKVKNGEAPQGVQDALKENQGDEAASQRIFGQYVKEVLTNNPRLEAAEVELQKASRLIDAVMVLGVNRTFRAQQMPPAEKAEELKKAEKTFLSIESVADQRGDFKLYLGRVYYWMGKEDQGQKLFDELMQKDAGSTRLVLAVADTLREVGASLKAKKLLEDEWNKPGVPEADRSDVAHLRALMSADLEEKILWLRRTDTEHNPDARATLHSALSRQAQEKGDEATAREELQKTLKAYDEMPNRAAVYNNSALGYLQLFRLSGDLSALEQAHQRLRKAQDLDRGSSITMSNLADFLYGQAVREMTKDRVDYSALRQTGTTGMLNYLHGTSVELEALRKKLDAHPSLRECMEYFQRLTVVSPKNFRPYVMLVSLHYFRRDVEKLRELQARVQTGKLDTTSYVEMKKKAWQKEDKSRLDELDAASKQAQARLLKAKSGKLPLTAVIALDQWIDAELDRALEGRSVDIDSLVKQAEQNYSTSPSSATKGTLISCLLYRAHVALSKADPEYKATADKALSALRVSQMIAVVLGLDGKLKQLAKANPDVIRAQQLIREKAEALPDETGPWSWAMLRESHPETAKQLAQQFAASEIHRLSRAISLKVLTMEPSLAMDEYWFHQSQGQEDKGKKVLKEFAARGVPLPDVLLK